MQPADVVTLMRRDTAQVLRQVERAQASAAALLQWYINMGGDTWANNVPDQVFTDAGITRGQFKKALADMSAFPAILNPTALGNIGDFMYKVQQIG